MKPYLAVLAGLALAAAAPANAYDAVVGRWKVSGEKGTCSANTMTAPGRLLFLFGPAPGGENGGGLAFTLPRGTAVGGEWSDMTFSGGGPAGKIQVHGEADFPGYWMPFQKAADVDAYPDAWQLRATAVDGAVMVDAPVTEFKAALAAVRACTAGTIGER